MPRDSWPRRAFSCIELVLLWIVRLPALWACGLVQMSDRLIDSPFIHLLLAPFPSSSASIPLRFEEPALQAGGRCAEECQETLRWSEPAASEQWRSVHVMRERACAEGETEEMCHRRETEKFERRVKDEKQKPYRWLCIYLFYIRKCVIPCLWCSSSFSMKDWDMFWTEFKESQRFIEKPSRCQVPELSHVCLLLFQCSHFEQYTLTRL